MSERAVRRARAGLVVVAAAVGCNAISGIDDFSASDPSGGSSASGGAAATGGAVATGGDAGTGGSAATAGTEGAAGVAGSAGAAGTAGDAGADVATGERCNGGTDEDADGRVDCFDSDCRDDPACAGFCSDAETLPCNIVRQAKVTSAAGSTARIGPPLYGCSGSRDEPGPEYAYRLTVPEGQRVFVELFGLDADMSLYAVDVASGAQCNAASACFAAGASGTGTSAESLTFSAATARDNFVIVDGLAAGNYSISVQCSSFDGCIPARAIEAGQTVTGSLVLGSAPNVTQKLTGYTCAGGSRGAPEAAFMFTPTVTADYQIDLKQFTTNADLFVLAAPNCNNVCLSQSSRSINPASADESLTLAATAGTTYYIVADAYGTSDFTLSVTQL